MTVAVSICNSALIKLGAERINALTDDNKRSRLCQEQYPKILKRILRSHPWNFALKRSKISPVTSTLDFGSDNVFPLPLDCARVFGVMADYDTTRFTDYRYKIEGKNVVSELDTINLKYVDSNPPEANFDEDFKEAVACSLAHDICYALTQSNTMKQDLLGEYEFWIAQARSHGAMEQTVDSLEFNEWDVIRR